MKIELSTVDVNAVKLWLTVDVSFFSYFTLFIMDWLIVDTNCSSGTNKVPESEHTTDQLQMGHFPRWQPESVLGPTTVTLRGVTPLQTRVI